MPLSALEYPPMKSSIQTCNLKPILYLRFLSVEWYSSLPSQYINGSKFKQMVQLYSHSYKRQVVDIISMFKGSSYGMCSNISMLKRINGKIQTDDESRIRNVIVNYLQSRYYEGFESRQ